MKNLFTIVCVSVIAAFFGFSLGNSRKKPCLPDIRTVVEYRDTCQQKDTPPPPPPPKRRAKKLNAESWEKWQWQPTKEPEAVGWSDFDWQGAKEGETEIKEGMPDLGIKTFNFEDTTAFGVVSSRIILTGELIDYRLKTTEARQTPAPIVVFQEKEVLKASRNVFGINGVCQFGDAQAPAVGVGAFYMRDAFHVGYNYLIKPRSHQIAAGMVVKF